VKEPSRRPEPELRNPGLQPGPEALAHANAELAPLPALERIRWAVKMYGDRAMTLASMQKASSVLLHMMAELELDNEILFVDTGFHFHETLRTRDELIRRYGLNIVTAYPELTPAEQEAHYDLKLYNYVDGQPECCRIRKEEPFVKHARDSGKRLVMLGLMRSEGSRRAALDVLSRDPRIDGHALHPLIDWDEARLDAYIAHHGVPVNPLHARGYPSIGCQVCTTPVTPGEDPRAGRWRHLRGEADGPRYCGINFSDGGGI